MKKAAFQVKHWRSEELVALIRTAYPLPTHVVITEVQDATAMRATRRADALVMGCWPSRGLDLVGVEIKVSRSDWLNELKNPAKAETFAQYCDRWVICAPESVVKEEEVPPVWGWWAPRGEAGGLSVKKAPEKLTDPKPISRLFLASMLRNLASGAIPKDEYQQRLKEGIAAGISEQRSHDKYSLEDLRERVKAFEEASGIKIGQSWDMGRIGEVVAMLKSIGVPRLTERVDHIRDQIAALHTEAQRVSASVRDYQLNQAKPLEEEPV